MMAEIPIRLILMPQIKTLGLESWASRRLCFSILRTSSNVPRNTRLIHYALAATEDEAGSFHRREKKISNRNSYGYHGSPSSICDQGYWDDNTNKSDIISKSVVNLMPSPVCVSTTQKVDASVSEKLSQKNQDQDNSDNERPSPDKLHAVAKVLEQSMRKIFISTIDYKVYSQDITLINNIRGKTTHGLTRYVQQVALLRTVAHLKFAYVHMDVLNMSVCEQEGRITIRWRIRGLSGLQVMIKFWKFKLWKWKEIMEQTETWFDGVSYYDIGSDGLVFRHIIDKVMVDKDQLETDKSSKSPLTAKLGVLASKAPDPETSLRCGDALKNISTPSSKMEAMNT